jgi:hypothetical protein
MVDIAPQAVTQTEAAAKLSPARYYVLALLTIVYALNFLDRTIFKRPDRADQKGVCAQRHYSLLSTAVTTMLGALLFVVAARWIRGDIKRAA